ncbi:MATE family efflux transporter [Flavobacteriaceae bacterium]|nr:MATE family efflux transporter [Flavobacteriaceae bacterium]MDA9015307.1 MATE family efflux transporter [Flavobacteriaceae bacterium]MDC3354079.1 MATE family efflux transporter [Flavobacteriaceae bacterium]
MILNFSQYTKEFKYNLTLAYPVIIGLLGHTFVQLVDNIMVGQLGTAELAAVSLGNSFFFVAMSLGIGFSTAITPLIAETDGANDVSSGRKVFIHGLMLCVFLGVLLSIAVWVSKPLLFQMGQPKEVVELAYPYLQWVGISLIPLIFFQGFKQFSEGLSHTRPAMYATLIGNIINIILNYFLIFGFWIFPKMGVEGAAIGSLFSRCSMLLFMALYVRFSPKFFDYVRSISFQKPQWNLFRKIIKLGFPSALQMFFEVLFFTAAIWLSGFLGKNPQAANQIALNLSSMTFMFAMGLGVTAMIRVGNQKGRKDFIRLREVAHSIFVLIFLFDVLFCLLFLTLNELLPWIYLDGNNPLEFTNVKEVVQIASTLLIVSAFFQISDGLQAVVLGALRGLQDVNIPAWITFFSYGVFGFPIAYYLGLYTDLAATGIWIGLFSGLTASSLLLFIRFRYLTNKLILN